MIGVGGPGRVALGTCLITLVARLGQTGRGLSCRPAVLGPESGKIP